MKTKTGTGAYESLLTGIYPWARMSMSLSSPSRADHKAYHIPNAVKCPLANIHFATCKAGHPPSFILITAPLYHATPSVEFPRSLFLEPTFHPTPSLLPSSPSVLRVTFPCSPVPRNLPCQSFYQQKLEQKGRQPRPSPTRASLVVWSFFPSPCQSLQSTFTRPSSTRRQRPPRLVQDIAHSFLLRVFDRLPHSIQHDSLFQE